ncbi:MAG: ribose 5-phosphate isomerase B [Hyphomicrobiales bacterium]|nr:ribose 5-phosphate isomerase B [Hyphomicrobiales bacterium]
MLEKTIVVASDHAGYDLKQVVVGALHDMSWTVIDLGADGTGPVDYPDMGFALANALRAQQAHQGVLVCGSGIGISIAANRYPEIRAALVHDTEGARLARQHNDANVICFGGRMIDAGSAIECLRVFLATDFEGGRHTGRVEKLSKPT